MTASHTPRPFQFTGRNLGLLALALLMAGASTLSGMDVTWRFADFTTSPLAVRQLIITPLAPYGVAGDNILLPEPIPPRTSTNGSVTVSNMVPGFSYRVELKGYTTRTLTNYFGTNVVGAVNAKDYLIISTNLGNGLYAYSQAAADARFLRTVATTNTATATISGNGTATNPIAVTVIGGGQNLSGVIEGNPTNNTFSTSGSNQIAAIASTVTPSGSITNGQSGVSLSGHFTYTDTPNTNIIFITGAGYTLVNGTYTFTGSTYTNPATGTYIYNNVGWQISDGTNDLYYSGYPPFPNNWRTGNAPSVNPAPTGTYATNNVALLGPSAYDGSLTTNLQSASLVGQIPSTLLPSGLMVNGQPIAITNVTLSVGETVYRWNDGLSRFTVNGASSAFESFGMDGTYYDQGGFTLTNATAGELAGDYYWSDGAQAGQYSFTASETTPLAITYGSNTVFRVSAAGIIHANGAGVTNIPTANLVGTIQSSNLVGLIESTNIHGPVSNVVWAAQIKDPTGFTGTPSGSFTASNSGSSNLLSWTGTAAYLMNGSSNWLTSVSVSIPTNTGTYFVYIPNGQSSFIVTNAAWALTDLQFATVFSDGTNTPFVVSEMHRTMPAPTHERFHLDPLLGAAWISGFTFSTNGAVGCIVGTGQFFDEDIHYTMPQVTQNWLAWRKVGGTYMNYVFDGRIVATNGTGGLQYDSNGTLMDVSVNGYVNVWIYVVPNADTNKQIVSVVGQSSSSVLATIRAETPPSLLPGFASQESVLLYRVTWRQTAGGPAWIETTDYRQSKLSGGSTISGATGTFNLMSASVVNGVVASASEANVPDSALSTNIARLNQNAVWTSNGVATASISTNGNIALINGATLGWRTAANDNLLSWGVQSDNNLYYKLGSTTLLKCDTSGALSAIGVNSTAESHFSVGAYSDPMSGYGASLKVSSAAGGAYPMSPLTVGISGNAASGQNTFAGIFNNSSTVSGGGKKNGLLVYGDNSIFNGLITATNGFINPVRALTYSGTNVTVDCSLSGEFSLLLTNHCLLIPTNIVVGKNVFINTRQHTNGTWLIYWTTNQAVPYFKFSGGVIPYNTTNANAEDVISLRPDYYGLNLNAVLTPNLQ